MSSNDDIMHQIYPLSTFADRGTGVQLAAAENIDGLHRPKRAHRVDETAHLAFTTKDDERLTGLTPRRLQDWDETAFIRPSTAARKGRGSPRLYSFRDLIQLRIAAQLRDRLSLQALRRLKAALDLDAPFAHVRFATTTGGEPVYLAGPGRPEAARKPGQIVKTFDVPLEEIRADLLRSVAALRPRRGAGHIERRRGVLGSRPVFAGTRIQPDQVIRMLEAGWTNERILDAYPDLRREDIRTARRLARAKAAG